MNLRKKITLGLFILAIGFVALAPIGPVPGFIIGGKESPAPPAWPDTSEIDEILLKVPGTPARVVIIWLVQLDDDLYVVGSVNSGWVQRIGQSSPVALRMQDRTYALQAQRVTENLEAIVTAYKDKYRADYPDIVGGFPTLEAARDSFAVFRLSAENR
jgi:hypothetical protein